ncbi:O-antigen/teichoic acid export membrane protein [Sphingomonas kyeonggiensis]|uniref:O-antigen/teichoic acid export membrane protein n=1 Tax=Sphingomonas kyeonggiensis TaxID=1268553 RepID=A0A7W7K196_9SPHN|nr:lipopolysaccharide biosynthesis protein [Sphingomonas kyeonggiensis]MBB4838525.1 O-antigen/teichoic acid export membrane protein [Sphingomonas kyeonggiensis]
MLATSETQGTSLRQQVRSAVIWRSGTQIFGQLLTWASTFIVIRLLGPSAYGLFAMTQVILVLLNMLNGYGLASALIQREDAGRHAQRQLFGMLILLNFALGGLQYLAAPAAAAYYRQPMVADLLRVQALLYIATPFIALPQALLSREMDFRRQALVNFVSALAGAITALAGALAGMGVWTLVAAPIALFATRAIGMTIAARSYMWPSFDFRGAGDIARYGGVMATGQIFWFAQSQADVFIAGRLFDPHMLGIYTTSLFLTQIFVSKFVPPLNEVAFSAYARLKDDKAAVGAAFTKSVRLVMLVAMPFYLGMAATAEPLVAVALGPKWMEAVPVVHWLALAMPMMTLQVLFAPASDACGRPGISAQNSMTGALCLPIAFLIGVHWGVMGLVAAWFAAYPLYLALSTWRTLPVIGVKFGTLVEAIAPSALAAGAMALIVTGLDALLPPVPELLRLALLVAAGGLAYAGLLFLFARRMLVDSINLVRNRGA